jgi:tRNA uridine 5-carboxymethylaminomethyl modification enzyme
VQGVVCGINAARRSNNEPLWEPSEITSFIGVLIKDLTYTGVTEPYRIFASRSDNRLSLREDNTEFRMSLVGKDFKIISNVVWLSFKYRYIDFHICLGAMRLKEGFFSNNFIKFKQYRHLHNIILKKVVLDFIIKRIGWYFFTWDGCIQSKLFIDVLYNGYIIKKSILKTYDKLLKFGNKLVYNIGVYSKIIGLSKEAVEKLNLAQPYTLKQASDISGVTFVDISIILRFLCFRS